MCSDWTSRATKITGWNRLTSTSDMKAWLASNGPLATCFTVYDDFFAYSTGIYSHEYGGVDGGHCVCVVGFDDADGYWICKNSWGTGWGDKGFFNIAYGQCGIDAEMWAVDGIEPTGKVILNETAIGGPALASINEANLAVAWTGTDSNHHLNVILAPDARAFGSKVTLGETSIDGPGFAFGAGLTFLAWTGTDSNHHLNLVSAPDARTFSSKITLTETSPFGPALAFGDGKLFLAWTGTDSSHSLNVLTSMDSGKTFVNKVTLGETSIAGPGLFSSGGTLYLLWAGTDGNHSLNILTSADGLHFGNKVTLGESSYAQPALAKLNDLLLAWAGRDSGRHLNSLTSAGDIHAFEHKTIFADTAAADPAVLAYKGRVYLSWTGTDSAHHVNVMPVF